LLSYQGSATRRRNVADRERRHGWSRRSDQPGSGVRLDQ
jgi:hypothetical protein